MAAIPYCLTPQDTYVKLGTISTNGFYNFTNNADGALVNIIAEPVDAVETFKISGSMMLSSRYYHHEQYFSTTSHFAKGLSETNWFYLRPSVPLPPRNHELVVRINLEKEATSPFNLILRYRTFGLPPSK